MKKYAGGGAKKYASGARTNISPPGEKIRPSLPGGVFRPWGINMPLGGEQIGGARPVVRGNHIEGGLAPQAAGQRKWPRLGRVARMPE